MNETIRAFIVVLFGTGLALGAPASWAQSDQSGRDAFQKMMAGQPAKSEAAAGVVSSDEIMRSLTTDPTNRSARTRGLEMNFRGIRKVKRAKKIAGKIDIKIYFDTNADTIKKESHAQIDQIGAALKSDALKKMVIGIEGHTDSVGRAKYNMDLSKRRADNVEKYLRERFGISPQRLVAVGRGESDPVATNITADGRAKNRRVTLVNKGNKKG